MISRFGARNLEMWLFLDRFLGNRGASDREGVHPEVSGGALNRLTRNSLPSVFDVLGSGIWIPGSSKKLMKQGCFV